MLIATCLAGAESPQAKNSPPASDTLADGLCWVYGFDQDLTGFAPRRVALTAAFQRQALAYSSDLVEIAEMVPRFSAGRLGSGIFIEYAGTGDASTNLLPWKVASADDLVRFTPVAGSTVKMVTPGAEGANGVRLESGPGGGFSLPESRLTVDAPGYTFSAYVRAAVGTAVEAVVEDNLGTAPTWAKSTATANGTWQRLAVTLKKPTAGPLPSLAKLRLSLPQGGWLEADAFMLESHRGYGGRFAPSTWLPGGVKGTSDSLSLGRPDNAQQGTIGFWARKVGSMGWRTLLCVEASESWYPWLRVDLMNDTQLKLVRDKKSATANLKTPDAWHHYAVSWNGDQLTLAVDGVTACSLTETVDPARQGRIYMGGTSGSGSPATRADAVFDEAAHWSRSLSADELTALVARPVPLADALGSMVTISDLEPMSVFARDDTARIWKLEITNRGTVPLHDLTATMGIPDRALATGNLAEVKPGERAVVSLPWSPAKLVAGAYVVSFAVRGSGYDLQVGRNITIVPARPPAGNLPVITWSGDGPDLADIGVTVGTINGSNEGPLPSQVENALRHRLYVQDNHMLRESGARDDERFLTRTDELGAEDYQSPRLHALITSRADRLGLRLATLPDVRYVTINSEYQTFWETDYRPASMQHALERFGLDLTPWHRAGTSLTLPLGRLSARAGGIVPGDGAMVAPDHPFYAFHRWWLGKESGSEVTLNQIILEAL